MYLISKIDFTVDTFLAYFLEDIMNHSIQYHLKVTQA